MTLLGLLLYLSGDPFVILWSLLLGLLVVGTVVSGPRFPQLETHLACWVLPIAVLAASWFVATTEPSVCFNCPGAGEYRAAIGVMAVYAFLGAGLLASRHARTPEAGPTKKFATMLTGVGIGTSTMVLVVDGFFLLLMLWFSFVEFP